MANARSLSPHPNVSGVETSKRPKDGKPGSCENLEPFLKIHGNEQMIRIVFLQLAHAVHHIHENGFVHGEITLDNIRLSEAKEKVVLFHSTAPKSQKSPDQKLKDITDLRCVFENIRKLIPPTESWNTNRAILEELLSRMKMSSLDAKDILEHPYFWNAEKILSFLVAVSNCTNTHLGGEMKVDLNMRSEDVFGAEWLSCLKLTSSEANQYRQMPHWSERQRKKQINVDIIVRSAGEKPYRTDELLSLVVFIRNRWVHFWDVKKIERDFYQNANGYWGFFNKRFPKLLPVVYHVIYTHDELFSDWQKSMFTIPTNTYLPMTLKSEISEEQRVEEGDETREATFLPSTQMRQLELTAGPSQPSESEAAEYSLRECNTEISGTNPPTNTELTTELEGEDGPPMKHVIDVAIDSCKETHVFELSHQQFSTADIDYLMKCLNELPGDFKFRSSRLRNCQVDEQFLQKLHKSARETLEIDLGANKKLDISALINFLVKSKAKSLDLSDCYLDEESVANLRDIQVTSLKLNYKAFICDSVSTTLAQMLKGGLKTLELANSSISTNDLEVLASGPRISLENLDLSFVTLNEDEMVAVAGIVNRTDGMNRLGLSDCDITTEALLEFHQVVDKKVRELDVSYNEEIDQGGDHAITSIVKKCKTEVLDISGRRLEGTNISQLRKGECQVKEVNLNENPGLDQIEVGHLVVDWKVEELNMRNCRLEAQDLIKLCDGIGDHKLQLLNVSDTTGVVSVNKINALQALSRKTERLIYGDHQTWA